MILTTGKKWIIFVELLRFTLSSLLKLFANVFWVCSKQRKALLLCSVSLNARLTSSIICFSMLIGLDLFCPLWPWIPLFWPATLLNDFSPCGDHKRHFKDSLVDSFSILEAWKTGKIQKVSWQQQQLADLLLLRGFLKSLTMITYFRVLERKVWIQLKAFYANLPLPITIFMPHLLNLTPRTPSLTHPGGGRWK